MKKLTASFSSDSNLMLSYPAEDGPVVADVDFMVKSSLNFVPCSIFTTSEGRTYLIAAKA